MDIVEKVGDLEGQIERYRNPSSFWYFLSFALTIIGIFLSIDYIFRLNLVPVTDFETSYLYCLFACFLSQVFIYIPANQKVSSNSVPWYDIVLFFLTVAINFYLSTQAYEIAYRGWDIIPPTQINILALILCILVLESVRRCGSLSLFLVCLIFALYPSFAGSMPGFLEGAQSSLRFVIGYHALGRESLLGIITFTYGNLLIGFLLFGVVLTATGGADAFMNFSVALLGSQRGGPAKVSIVSSALFGTLSGSVISNIITTGSFTIPTMKKTGYSAEFAGAIETVASTGGNIMPPVMGAAAFIMAVFLNMPYWQVCKAAAIPALLYYYALYMQVHCYAEKHNLRGVDREIIPSLKSAIIDVLPYFIAIFALAYFLYLGLEGRAPFIGSIFLIIVCMMRKKTRVYFISQLSNFYKDLRNTLVSMIGLLTGIGFIVGSLMMTGLGGSFSHDVVALAGGNKMLILIFAALGSIVLGMGMPAVTCYIFLSVVIVPALLGSDILPIAAHLFVFYWGLASYLTPPVALGASTASVMAQGDFLKTAFLSMRLGFLIYLVPFFFVFHPSLLLQTPVNELILPLCTIIVGILLIAGGFEGYLVLLKWKIDHLYQKIMLIFAGVGLLIPGLRTDLIGLVIFIFFIILFYFQKKATKKETEADRKGGIDNHD